MENIDFGSQLIAWYNAHHRDLPWRQTTDPYFIWLSEIILQQTRVDQGLAYYQAFTELFPTVHDLANAPEDEVLRAWQGLGYYSRARNLHFTAKHISSELHGQFPSTYADIIQLKGVGPYTAAAIASFAFNEVMAVVDGNVFRVLARVFGIALDIMSNEGKKAFQELANELITPKQPALFNQAIMEFGATWCTPKNPQCHSCIFQGDCVAFAQKKQDSLPRKLKKVQVKTRYFNYLIITNNHSIVLNRRGAGDIWEGLYDFPLIETTSAMTQIELEKHEEFQSLFGAGAHISMQSDTVKHVLSHQRILATFWHVDSSTLPTLTYYSPAQVESLPNPVLVDNYLKAFDF